MDSKSNKTMWITLGGVVLVAAFVVYLFMPDNGQAVDQSTAQGPSATVKQASASPDREEVKAPEFALKNTEGNVVKLSDHKGKVVFVNFWATWCPPCRAEIPYFVELIDQYKKDFVVLGISVDSPRDIPKVPGFAKDYNINYPVLYTDSQTVNAYGGINSIPTTFVVDQEGFVVGRIVGSRPKAEFERIIKELL